MSRASQTTIDAVALKLGIDPSWIDKIIKAESGWNPTIQSGIPYNKARLDDGTDTVPKYARGLIQFIDTTAQGLGYKDSLDLVTKYPTSDAQLAGPVYEFYRRQMPFPNAQSFAMATMYPKYRSVAPDTLFPSNVRKSNPGINTPRDYVNRVFGKGALSSSSIAPFAIAVLIGGYFLARKYGLF